MPVDPRAPRLVAGLPGVRAAVQATGREIQGRAEALLAQHRDTGAARIEGSPDGLDYVVDLVDPAAATIEFGRAGYTTPGGRQVGPMQGLRILTRAAGI